MRMVDAAFLGFNATQPQTKHQPLAAWSSCFVSRMILCPFIVIMPDA